MARARKQNGIFGFLTKKRETYRRDVKGERADLVRKAKSEKARRAKVDRERKSEERAQERKEAMALRREELAEKKKQRKSPLSSFMGTRMYKTGSGEYMTSIDDSRFDSIRDAKEFVKSMRSNPRRKRNPEAAAAELSEAWHGRPAKTATDVIEQVHYHGVLTDLGRLKEITVMVTARKGQKIFFDAETRLASSENGKQLYVVGGDQSLDLEALGIEGEEAEKDCVVVGDIFSIVYVTAKQHLGKEDRDIGPYEHELGEDSGTMPILIYDTMNQEVGFAGGSYFIDPTDYDGRHSAGIRN